MMFGYKHTFRVSWGLGQGVRGLGVRGGSGHGTINIGTDSHLTARYNRHTMEPS